MDMTMTSPNQVETMKNMLVATMRKNHEAREDSERRIMACLTEMAAYYHPDDPETRELVVHNARQTLASVVL